MLGIDRATARRVWTASLVVGGLYAAYVVRSTLFVFVLGVFVAYTVHPLVAWLVRHGPRRLPRSAATLIAFALLLLVIAGVIGMVGPRVSEQASHLAEQAKSWKVDASLADRIPLPGWLEPQRARLFDFVQRQFGGSGGPDLASAAPAARQIGVGLMHLASGLIDVVIVPIVAILLIIEAPNTRRRFLAWAELQPHASMWRGLADDLDRLLGGYIRALASLAFAVAASYAVVLSIAGVPYALVLAIGAGVMEIVPVAGPLAAALVTLVVAGFSGYAHVLALAAFLAVYRMFQDYVLSPRLMSAGAAVPALFVLLGLLAGAEVGGIAGVFLAVPAIAAMRLLVLRVAEASRDAALRSVTPLIGDDAPRGGGGSTATRAAAPDDARA